MKTYYRCTAAVAVFLIHGATARLELTKLLNKGLVTAEERLEKNFHKCVDNVHQDCDADVRRLCSQKYEYEVTYHEGGGGRPKEGMLIEDHPEIVDHMRPPPPIHDGGRNKSEINHHIEKKMHEKNLDNSPKPEYKDSIQVEGTVVHYVNSEEEEMVVEDVPPPPPYNTMLMSNKVRPESVDEGEDAIEVEDSEVNSGEYRSISREDAKKSEESSSDGSRMLRHKRFHDKRRFSPLDYKPSIEKCVRLQEETHNLSPKCSKQIIRADTAFLIYEEQRGKNDSQERIYEFAAVLVGLLSMAASQVLILLSKETDYNNDRDRNFLRINQGICFVAVIVIAFISPAFLLFILPAFAIVQIVEICRRLYDEQSSLVYSPVEQNEVVFPKIFTAVPVN